MARSKLDEILCGHASDLDGQPINVGTLTAHLIRASFDSDRMTAAALLHAWWGPAGDQLSPRLAQLNDACDDDREHGVDHTPPCHLYDQGQCDTCDDITYDAVTDALDALRALLGDAVCTDLAVTTSLVLRTCAADGTSHDGFVWPEAGPVACSDWEPTAKCGHGLHGALWGEGNGNLFRWDADARWQVLEVPTDTIVDLGGKVKFPAATVLFTGDRLAATAFLAERAPGRAIIGGTATAGYRGTATAGDYGIATAGDAGTATAGDSGTATAGYRGTATAGYRGTATAGNHGTICVRWHDGDRYRLTIGYIGEDGLDAGTAYRCDRAGQLVAVTA